MSNEIRKLCTTITVLEPEDQGDAGVPADEWLLPDLVVEDLREHLNTMLATWYATKGHKYLASAPEGF